MKRRRGDGLTTRFPPWMCHACGHLCSAASSLLYDAVPGEGDVCACINCAAPAILRNGKWVKPSDADWAEIEPETRRELTLHQIAIRDMHATVGRPSDRRPKWRV